MVPFGALFSIVYEADHEVMSIWFTSRCVCAILTFPVGTYASISCTPDYLGAPAGAPFT